LHIRINLSLILSLSDTKTVVISYFKTVKKKGKSKVFPVLALKVCRVSRSVTPLILNPSAGWRWVDHLMP